ncbi:MAG: radical SAM protein [Saprospiraceae bacterium]|nr:radical SAM protein [Saprospiraceae bacterium]
MRFYPIDYDEPLFRPPSEGNSSIIQITLGCSWNNCAFCEMYSTKKFKVRKEEDVFKDIETLARINPQSRKVFLADGNAMVLSTNKLLKILEKVKSSFPKVNRISAYALPGDIIPKSEQELKELRDAGLKLIYVGIESGDDELLKVVNKGETFKSTVEGLNKSKLAGIESSVMILTGLGGKQYSKQHAINSAKVLNETQPHFASTLVLSFPFGEEHYRKKFNGNFVSMSTLDLIKEMEVFLKHTELESTIFRSDHASNYLVLKGILSKDKDSFLEQIRFAIKNPELAGLRPEWLRGL